MKIIDKRKDYYDYLQGIWGPDPKAVYYRRAKDVFKSNERPEFFAKTFPDGICGYEGYISLVCGRIIHRIRFINGKYGMSMKRYQTEFFNRPIGRAPMLIEWEIVFNSLFSTEPQEKRLAIYDTMQLIQPNVATICTGMAASMGSLLLCAGERGKRSVLPHARIMVHQPLGGVQGQASDILIEAKEIEKIRTELFSIIAQHSGQVYEKVARDGERNFWMTAKEAMEYGMVDYIMQRKEPDPRLVR